MATSPNFNWPEPDNSDLVKNGALAIRTAVDAIDASMVDLKGGTTGQVLSKTSNTDMDFTWVAQDDSNAIQNAIVDAKGDLIAATAADTPARLAVGANNLFLRANSGAATGLEWAGTYTTYTPTLVNITQGNGLIVARYLQIGKLVHVEFEFTMGTTSAMGSGPQFTLPIAATLAQYRNAGVCTLQDAGTANVPGNAVFISTGTVFISALTTSGTYIGESSVTATVPFTWTTNDRITVSLVYEGA